MDFWKNTLSFLQSEMQTPTNYGWFHLMFIAFVIIGSFFCNQICKEKFCKSDENCFNCGKWSYAFT